jgi:hypothetical protein
MMESGKGFPKMDVESERKRGKGVGTLKFALSEKTLG